MPAIANIVLTDRAATPVDHTFTFRDKDYINPGVGLFATETGVSASEAKLTLSKRATATKRKSKLVLVVPTVVTETINGVDRIKVERYIRYNVECDADVNSTEQERQDANSMVMSALGGNSAVVDGVIVSGEGLW